MSNTKEKIQEMAKLTMLSNKLNDIQLKNLKAFPLVFFEGVMKATMDYDLSNNLEVETEENAKELETTYKFGTNPGHLRVSYHLVLNEFAQQTFLDKRFEALETSVRGLLWPDIKVQVYFGDKLVFESKKATK